MKKVPEEELIRIAFGEASEEESRRLLADSDPGTAMKLDLYRRLRADLRDMATDVPEPQLSQERLQEAILRAGLKRERRAWSWSWAFAPMAALAIGVLFINRRPDLVEPLQPTRETIEAPEAAAPAPDADKAVKVHEATAPVSEIVAPAAKAGHVSAPSARRVVRTPVGARDKLVAVTTPDRLVAGTMKNLAALGMADRTTHAASRGGADSRPASPDAPTTALSAAVPADAMVVLIATETDAATGANLAIEVASTSNVVIGS